MAKKISKNFKDYYSILGVPANTTETGVKKAFHTLAWDCHPDHNKEEASVDRFKEVNEAYRALKDPSKRNKLDANLMTDFCRLCTKGHFSLIPKRKSAPSEFLRLLKGDKYREKEQKPQVEVHS
ncbi:MAG: DnaJ domain-containing protein [Magnetococcales bacterium]|nr:DnaJ domain-containing protein [Magnetococcales bacterium]